MKALLLIDIQNQARDKFHKDYINDSFVKNIVSLIDYAESNEMPVIHIVTEYTDKQMPALNKQKGYKYFMKGSYDAEEIKEIAQTFKSGHYKIIKHHYDSFWKTNLDKLLSGLDVNELLISGIYTHWCVLSTVFSAISRDYDITVVTDCTESRYPDLGELIFKNILDKRTSALQIKTLSEITTT